MIIEVIPPKKWSSFLTNFSRLNKELLCSIQILDGPLELNAGEQLKFATISFIDNSETDLNIIANREGKEINHLVKDIKQICVTRTNEGGESSVLIESAGDYVTSLNFGKENY